MDFSLRVNRKAIATDSSPDRDQQFRYISSLRTRFERQGLPMISVDTKKRELVGNFKNNGVKWDRTSVSVNDHDFRSDAIGVAIPYGIYDLLAISSARGQPMRPAVVQRTPRPKRFPRVGGRAIGTRPGLRCRAGPCYCHPRRRFLRWASAAPAVAQPVAWWVRHSSMGPPKPNEEHLSKIGETARPQQSPIRYVNQRARRLVGLEGCCIVLFLPRRYSL